jgi:hypothetical protein
MTRQFVGDERDPALGQQTSFAISGNGCGNYPLAGRLG